LLVAERPDHDDTRTEGASEARTILQGIRKSDEKAEGVLRGRRRGDADRVTVGQVREAQAPVGAAAQVRAGSNRMVSEPRRLSALSQARQSRLR
jgi:hypothetical protein